MVYRIYVEKRPEYAVEAGHFVRDPSSAAHQKRDGLRLLNRYDVEGHLRRAVFPVLRHRVQ